MRDKIARFMYGRYGADEFSKFLFHSTLLLFVLCIILNLFRLNLIAHLCYWAGFMLIIYSYTRMFSKNISKRYTENQKFLLKKMNIIKKFNSEKAIVGQRKDYHFYRCPSCHQRIRIPRGKGRIEIRCPKCSTTFIKKS